MITAGVIGATGYAGAETYRLLLCHKMVEKVYAASVSYEGQQLSDLFQNFYQRGDNILLSPDELIEKCDIIFAGVPHGAAEEYAKKAHDMGKKFVDLGADFRLTDEAQYKKYYKGEYKYPELHKEAVYGLPERYREKIRGASLIGNPGCYPTSAVLGLMPALAENLVERKGIIIDSKSGVTGAGMSLTRMSHYPDCNEALQPYKVGAHQHTPEIEQLLSDIAGEPMTVTFTPHLVPLNRGIESTIYADFKPGVTLERVHEAYQKAYENETFVRVLPLGKIANLKWVRMSNFCDISLHEDAHAGKLILVACIDNMVKGTAGAALQNMNLMYGWPETEGLLTSPPVS